MRQTPTNPPAVDDHSTPSTRERIVRGARIVFERLGYEATRVEDILQEASVSRPTFYRVFRNKEEVYAEITDAEVPKARTARERVLEGAREAFGRLGYEAARVEDILEASGVSRPTFYRVFASKQEAFEDLDKLAVSYLVRAIEGIAEHRDGALDHLELVIASYFEWRIGLRLFHRGEKPASEPPGISALRASTLGAEAAKSAFEALSLVSAIDVLATTFHGFDSAQGEELATRRAIALELVQRHFSR